MVTMDFGFLHADGNAELTRRSLWTLFATANSFLTLTRAVVKFSVLFLTSLILSEGLVYILLWKDQMLKGEVTNKLEQERKVV